MNSKRFKQKISNFGFAFVNIIVLTDLVLANTVQISSYSKISKNGEQSDGGSVEVSTYRSTEGHIKENFVYPQKFNETTNSSSNNQPSVNEQNNNSQQIKLPTATEAKENEQLSISNEPAPSTGRAIANQQYPFPLNSNYFVRPNTNSRQNEKQAKYYPAYNHRNTYDSPKPVVAQDRYSPGMAYSDPTYYNDRQSNGYLPPGGSEKPLKPPTPSYAGPVTVPSLPEKEPPKKYTPPMDLYNFPPNVDASWGPTYDTNDKYKDPISSYLPPPSGLNDESIGTINVPGDDSDAKPMPPAKKPSGPPSDSVPPGTPEYLDHPPPGYEDPGVRDDPPPDPPTMPPARKPSGPPSAKTPDYSNVEYLDHPPPGYEDPGVRDDPPPDPPTMPPAKKPSRPPSAKTPDYSNVEYLDHPPPGYEDPGVRDDPAPDPPTMPPKKKKAKKADPTPPASWNGYQGHDVYPEVIYDHDPHEQPPEASPAPPPPMPPPSVPDFPKSAPWDGYHGHDSFPEVIYDYPHDHDHHHHHIETTPAPPPPPPPAPPRRKKYGYYLIGRKFWYIPLYFTIYFVAYLALLIIKSIFRKKVDFPNHYARAIRSVHDWSHTETVEKVNQITEFTLKLIDDFAMKNKRR